jgi:hypothetical protein
MVRMVSLRRFTTRLRPELEHRLKTSLLSSWRGDLLLDDGCEAARLRINRGQLQVASAEASQNSISGGEAIVQLMLGTDDPNEIIDLGGIRLRGQARALIPVLFPNEYPALSFWDRF